MNTKFKRLFSLLIFFIFLAFTVSCLVPQSSEARRTSFRSSGFKNYSKSSGSWKKSYSPSKKVWGERSGGGIFGLFKKSSSGYKKPESNKVSGTTSSSYSKTKKEVFGKTTTNSSSGYKKSSSKKGSIFKSGSKFDQKIAKSMKKQKSASSLASYKAEKQKFKKPAEPVRTIATYQKSPVFNKAKTYSDYDYRTHYSTRNNYYSRYGWQQPSYVFSSQPRFGMWDALVWWMVLDNLTSRNHYAMAHHHSSDPGYQQWRREAEQLAQTNSDLKEKLRVLDNKVDQMKGEPKNEDYLPDDMPAEIAIAADVLAAKKPEKPEFILATASETGNYHRFGKLLKVNADSLNVKLRTTAGSMENLQLLVNNEIHGAIVQSDAFTVYKQKFPNSKLDSTEQVPLYNEAVQMIANKNSDIKSVKEIDPEKHVLYIGPKGSGTAMTWFGFCSQDSAYKDIKVKYAPYQIALERVIKDQNAVMMFVSGLNSKLLQYAEKETAKNNSIRLVQVDDWNFNNSFDDFGNRIYKFVDIPSNTYPNLQKTLIFFAKDIETIAVEAILVVKTQWAEKYGPEAMDNLSFAIMETQPVIAQRVNATQ